MVLQTVLGPVPPEAFGPTDCHDHLIARPPAPYATEDPDLVLDAEEPALAELLRFRAAGGTALVECTTVDYGRDAATLRRLSAASGVHIVAVTGFNKGKFSASVIAERTVAAWTERAVQDVTAGMDGMDIRAGAVKAASSLDRFLPEEETAFVVAAAVHRATGVPVLTHTEAGTCGPEQLDRLERLGVDPRRVVLGHLDRKLQWAYLAGLARRGCFLSFDQVGKRKYGTDAARAAMLARLADAGFGDQLLIGGDFARRSYWMAHGGTLGPAHLLTGFVGVLDAAGFTPADTRRLLVENPRRAWAF